MIEESAAGRLRADHEEAVAVRWVKLELDGHLGSVARVEDHLGRQWADRPPTHHLGAGSRGTDRSEGFGELLIARHLAHRGGDAPFDELGDGFVALAIDELLDRHDALVAGRVRVGLLLGERRQGEREDDQIFP